MYICNIISLNFNKCGILRERSLTCNILITSYCSANCSLLSAFAPSFQPIAKKSIWNLIERAGMVKQRPSVTLAPFV